jgi:hypothetical protein
VLLHHGRPRHASVMPLLILLLLGQQAADLPAAQQRGHPPQRRHALLHAALNLDHLLGCHAAGGAAALCRAQQERSGRWELVALDTSRGNAVLSGRKTGRQGQQGHAMIVPCLPIARAASC